MIRRFVYFTTVSHFGCLSSGDHEWNERKFDEKRIDNFIFFTSLRFASFGISTSFSVKTVVFICSLHRKPAVANSVKRIFCFLCLHLLVCVWFVSLHHHSVCSCRICVRERAHTNDYLWPTKPFAIDYSDSMQCNLCVHSMFVVFLNLVIPKQNLLRIHCFCLFTVRFALCGRLLFSVFNLCCLFPHDRASM